MQAKARVDAVLLAPRSTRSRSCHSRFLPLSARLYTLPRSHGTANTHTHDRKPRSRSRRRLDSFRRAQGQHHRDCRRGGRQVSSARSSARSWTGVHCAGFLSDSPGAVARQRRSILDGREGLREGGHHNARGRLWEGHGRLGGVYDTLSGCPRALGGDFAAVAWCSVWLSRDAGVESNDRRGAFVRVSRCTEVAWVAHWTR